jgi:hypothetical protein
MATFGRGISQGLILFSRSWILLLFAAVMGFALGGSVVSALQKPVGHWYDVFAEHPTDWLLVLFNGILAAFTVRLFYAAADQSSDVRASVAVAQKGADAADLSAKAALRVEQPILTARPPLLVGIKGPMPTDRTYGGVSLASLPDQNCVLSTLTFVNHGRTPAILSSLHVGYLIGRENHRPRYSRTIHFRDGAIISPNREPFPVSVDFDFNLQDDQRTELRRGAILWVWTLLVYDDFMDLRLGKEFAWQWGRYPEDSLRPNTYHFMALKIRDKIDPELLRSDYESAAD